MAFIIMRIQGINANIMSLGGITIAIGTMIDGAIVMIENVHKHHAKNPNSDRFELIKIASIEVGPPLFFSLLIITLSFLPVFSLQAQEGRLFSPLAYTKTYAMAAAALLSITLVPVLMGYLIRGRIIKESHNPLNRFLMMIYRPVINLTLKYPITLLILTCIFVIVSVWPLTHLGSEFMPTLDEGDLMYMPTTLPGVSIGKAQQILQQTDKLIKSVPEVKSVFGKMGRANTATDPAPLTMIESVIQFKPQSQWRKGMTKEKLKQELNQIVKLPGLTNAWVMPIKTRIDMLATGIKTPIGIKISGPSLLEIEKIGIEFDNLLKPLPGTLSVYADRAIGGRYISINIDRKKAARYGLSIKDINQVVQTAIGGMIISHSVEGRESYPINLRYPESTRNSLQTIKLLPIVTNPGANIPLADVANVTITNGPPVIKSENARLTGWVLIDIDNIDIGQYIKTAKKVLAKDLSLPPGYSLTWSGQYEYMMRAKEKLLRVAPLTLLIIFVLLYLSFKSVKEVLIILLTLPLALTGGVWLLYSLDYHLSVAVGVGFIALAGVAVEIGVLILAYLNQSLYESQRASRPFTLDHLENAVIEGSLLRVRPIAMTVFSVVIGLLPVMLGQGVGSEVMKRIAAPMVGGMISALVLTLIVIPAIYYLWQRRKLKKFER